MKNNPVPDQFPGARAGNPELVLRARSTAAQNVNTLRVITSFGIGRRIVEYKQKGSKEAIMAGR